MRFKIAIPFLSLAVLVPAFGAFSGSSPVQAIAAADTSLRVVLPAAGSQVSITVAGKVGVYVTLGDSGCAAKDTAATKANQNVFLAPGSVYVRSKGRATCFAVVRANADSAVAAWVETGGGSP